MKDTTKSWWKGYYTAAVLCFATQLGIFGVCKALPTYHEGNKVLETRVSHSLVERVLEKDGRPGLSYEDHVGSYTGFFPDAKLRDVVRGEMAYRAATSRYCSTELRRLDKDRNKEITAEEVRAAFPYLKQ